MPSITAAGICEADEGEPRDRGQDVQEDERRKRQETTTPTTKAVTSRRRSTGRPATIAEAPTTRRSRAGVHGEADDLLSPAVKRRKQRAEDPDRHA